MSNFNCTIMLDKHTHNIHNKLGEILTHAKVQINYRGYFIILVENFTLSTF